MSWQSLDKEVRTQLTQRLTQRQLNILILWLAGCSYERIASMSGLSVRTVRTHLKRARVVHDYLNSKDAA